MSHSNHVWSIKLIKEDFVTKAAWTVTNCDIWISLFLLIPLVPPNKHLYSDPLPSDWGWRVCQRMWILTGCYENALPRRWQRKIQLASSRIQLALLEKSLAQIQTQQNEITTAFQGRWIRQILKPGLSVVPKSNQKHFSMDCISSGFPSLCIKRREAQESLKVVKTAKSNFSKVLLQTK